MEFELNFKVKLAHQGSAHDVELVASHLEELAATLRQNQQFRAHTSTSIGIRHGKVSGHWKVKG